MLEMAKREHWLSFTILVCIHWCAVECGVTRRESYTQSGGRLPTMHTKGLDHLFTGPYFGRYKMEERLNAIPGTTYNLPQGHYDKFPANYTAEFVEWLGEDPNAKRIAVGASPFLPRTGCRRV